MKRLGMLIRDSCSLSNHQAYISFTCFLRSKKKKLSKMTISMPVKAFYLKIAKTTNLYCPS